MKKAFPRMAQVALCSVLISASVAWAQNAPPLKGEVLEVKDVPGYTYLRLKTAAGETWAAVTTAGVKTGTTVSIVNPTTMQNFQSKVLNRQFDRIVFGSLDGPAAGPATMAPFGLCAGIYTRDISRAMAFARDVDAGQVFINQYFAGGVPTPFGGTKMSGFGREKGMAALASYYRVKCITN